MNLCGETIDAQLLEEVRRCSGLLIRRRYEITRLTAELSWPLPMTIRTGIEQGILELRRKGDVIDRRLDALQKEQRIRAASNGQAIATCRVAWL